MQLQFDATQVAPDTGKSVCFPLDNYKVEIVKTEGRQVKNSTNKGMLVITLRVTEGPYAGQTQEDRLNLFNDNEMAVRIAYARLSAYCHAIGRLQITDSDQLIGGKLAATFGPQDANPEYSEVKKVMTAADYSPMPPPAAPTPAPSTAPAWSAPASAPAEAPAPASAPPASAAPPWANGGASASAAPPWAKAS